MSFERGRQTRNPSRSNARFKLSCPFKVLNYKMDFDVYEQLELAEFYIKGLWQRSNIIEKLRNLKIQRKVITMKRLIIFRQQEIFNVQNGIIYF